MGRIEVDDAAPLGELADAVHLIPALIASSQQPGDDLPGRDGLTGGEGGAVLPEGFRGNGALERCLGRRTTTISSPQARDSSTRSRANSYSRDTPSTSRKENSRVGKTTAFSSP